MKAIPAFLLVASLCACRTQKPVTIAFNGWQGKDFLKQGCTALQRDYDHVRSLPVQQQAVLFAYSDKAHMPCLASPDELNVRAESALMTAFASNPECGGVKMIQGFYDPGGDVEASRAFNAATFRLDLDLNPSGQTGEVSFADSQWTIQPRTLSGSLADLDKATTAICRIAKGEGAQ